MRSRIARCSLNPYPYLPLRRFVRRAREALERRILRHRDPPRRKTEHPVKQLPRSGGSRKLFATSGSGP